VKPAEEDFRKILVKHGVMVSPGSFYFPRRAEDLQFRVSISNVKEPEIAEGILRLGRALREVLTGRSPARRRERPDRPARTRRQK
jgi:DNA-binding transcriptional MocR family regulator